MSEYLLTIDLGSAACKVMIFDRSGNPIIQVLRRHLTHNPKQGVLEQDANEWWKNTVMNINDAIKRTKIKPDDIHGIGVTGHGTDVVCLDRKGKVLRPVIYFLDTRASSYLKELTNNLPIGYVSSKFYPNLLWIRDNEPTVDRSINFILDSKEYIGYKLGNKVTNDGLFFALESKEMKKLNKEFHIPKEWFGKPHGYTEVAMHVTKNASRETGLKEDTPIVIGSSDSFSSIAGSGSIDEGIAVDTAGTTEVISITVGRKMPSTIFSHFKPGFWFTFISPPLGLAHQWYANLLESLKILNKKTHAYDFINNEAAKSPLGSKGLIFIPTLKQEYGGPPISGGFFGVSVGHEIKHFSRAVLEGISFRLKEILEDSETCSVPIKEIRLGGGGAKSDLWNQMRADIIGKDFAVLKVLESTSLGVALLASIGIGIYSDLDDATYNMVRVSKILRPNKEKHDKYAKLYSIYRKINHFNKKLSSELMNL